MPVLCYHRVEVPPPGATYDGNFVEPVLFASHLTMLAELGCTGVTVRDLSRWQRGEQVLPARAVVISFDDAYQSVVEHALPQLAERAWGCTIYAVSAKVGGKNTWDAGAPRASLMDAAALRAALMHGCEIGSHSRQHTRIRGLEDTRAHEELRGSREDLESIVGAAVESFAFPYGSHDPHALEMVRSAGYRTSVTLKRWANGRGTNPFRIGRVGVGGPLPAWQLRLKLLKAMLTPARA